VAPRSPGRSARSVGSGTPAWRNLLAPVLNVVVVGYVVVSFKRVYGGGWMTNALRTAPVGVVYAAFVVFALLTMTRFALS